MTEFVRVRTENGYETSMPKDYAESVGAEIIDVPAVNRHGKPLPVTRKDGRPDLPRTTVDQEAARRAAAADSGVLKGKALDEALEAAGLTTSGTADEKRKRLADHQDDPFVVAD